MSRHPATTVAILEKEYQVACPPEQQDELLEASRYLDRQMREIRASGKVIGLERVAIMAAINLSYELLVLRRERAESKGTDPEQLANLTAKLDEALYQLRQMEIG